MEKTFGMSVVQEGESFVVLDKNGNFFAKTYSSTDARLIAAAPDLLEACKQAADWLARSVRADDLEQAQDLRAAIAKAEGAQ